MKIFYGFQTQHKNIFKGFEPKNIKSSSKILALFHIKEVPFSTSKFKPRYLEHTNLNF
jgi:hypothetical protein